MTEAISIGQVYDELKKIEKTMGTMATKEDFMILKDKVLKHLNLN